MDNVETLTSRLKQLHGVDLVARLPKPQFNAVKASYRAFTRILERYLVYYRQLKAEQARAAAGNGIVEIVEPTDHSGDLEAIDPDDLRWQEDEVEEGTEGIASGEAIDYEVFALELVS